MNDENDDLMSRIATGDMEAYATLIEAWQSPLIGYFTPRLRDSQLAEDACQETLIRVHANASDYVPSGRFKSWLFRIAHNLFIDATRRRKRDVIANAIRSLEGADGESVDIVASLPSRVETPCDIAERHESSMRDDDLMRMILDAVDDVPAEQGFTLIAQHLDGKTTMQIASESQSPHPTVKSRLRLAQNKVRRVAKATLSLRSFGAELMRELA